MAVTFANHTPGGGRHKDKPRVYVTIGGQGVDGKDTVHRPATEADFAAYAREYAAFTGTKAAQAPAATEATKAGEAAATEEKKPFFGSKKK